MPQPRRYGIPPATAIGQAQKDQTVAGEQPFPLPAPTGPAPYVLDLAAVLPVLNAKARTFHVFGDSGGVKDPNPQLAVAAALVADQQDVEFAYSVGDVVYFNGDEQDYPSQFYEPYAHYNRPIVAIPGNHDGDNTDNPAVASLAGFVVNFCAATPTIPPGLAEYQRDTMTQPNVYWTLDDQWVTIIGLYSNVPSGGHIDSLQSAWLTNELETAPKDRPLIVALHHPPYSVDAHHGGSAAMGAVLDQAFEDAGRWPNLVLAGHVHDYQRLTRQVNGRTVSYVVIGNSGYHNLHKLAVDAHPGLQVTDDTTFEYGDDSHYGFLRLVCSATGIAGVYTQVAKDGTVTPAADQFAIPL